MRLRTPICTLAIAAGISTPATAQEQFTNLEAAIAAAQKGGKDIIVDFTGSDWCGWCIRLRNEVFDTETWGKTAGARYVFVEVDFPRHKRQSAEQRRYNKGLQERFGVSGYPTVFVLDSAGRAYAKTGYKRGGAKAYMNHLERLAERKDQVAELQAKTNADDKIERLGAIEDLLACYKEWQLDHLQIELKQQAVELGSSKRGEYSADLAAHFMKKGDEASYDKYLAICRKADPAKALVVEIDIDLDYKVVPLCHKQDWSRALEEVRKVLKKAGGSPAAQRAYFLAGAIAFNRNDATGCVRFLEKGIRVAPRTQLAKKLRATIQRVRAAAKPGK